MKKNNQSESAILRQQAEELLSKGLEKSSAQLTEAEIYKLLHELQVHQIELRLQNDELIMAKGQSVIATEKYIELYDFAPSGYFTLSSSGNIIGLNLTGALMLGQDRLQIKNRLFQFFISESSKPIFRLFLRKVFSDNVKESCELALSVNGNKTLYVFLTGVVAENRNHCYVTATDITELKQAEVDLRISNEFNQSLLKTIPFKMDIVNEQGNILYISEGLKQHFGADALGKKCWKLYRDDQQQCDDCPLFAGIKIGLTQTYEAHGVLGGRIFEVTHTGMIFNGQKAILEIFIDITERKQAEEELLNKDALLNLTGHTAKVGGWELDTETLKQTWTKEVYLIHEVDFTFNPDVSNGINFYAPQSRPIIEKALQRVIEFGEPFDLELEFITSKGKHLWVHSIGEAYQVNGVTKKVYGSFQDITERKQTEESLLMLKTAIEKSEVSVLITDFKGNIKYANPYFTELTGYTASEYIEQNPKILKSDFQTKEYYEELWNTITSGKTWEGELYNRKKNGEYYWENAIISPVENDKNEITHFVAIKTDITHAKNTQSELIKAKEHAEESDQLKSAFLANMSHEIRTPLNSIIGFSDLLNDPDFDQEQKTQFTRSIIENGNNLMVIISDILDLSMIAAGQIKFRKDFFSIQKLLEDLDDDFKMKASGKGIDLRLSVQSDGQELIIENDNYRIKQILTNLIGNAIKFTSHGFVEFGYLIKGENIEFQVKDTGIGIAPEYFEAIFDRFRQVEITKTRRYGGNGLGLAISKNLAELLGGKIWVESEVGKGSTFHLSIPIHSKSNENTVSPHKIETPVKEIQIRNLKILIAEDEEDSSKLISIGVRKYASEIINVQSGTEAVDACRNNPDIDLVLMDIQMPEMDGYEATMQIRKFNPDVVIIAQTAFALNGDKEKALEAGCTDYISKPICRDELMKMIQKYFSK